MPRIPLDPLPNARSTAAPSLESLGGGASAEGLGRSVGELGQFGQQVAAKEMADANDAWAKDAYTKLLSKKNDLIYGQNGAMARKGNDAQAAITDTTENFDKAVGELADTASNESQRSMFRHMATQEGVELNQALLHHASQERDQMKEDIFKSLVSTSTDDAVLNYDVAPWKSGATISRLKAAAMTEADRRGWTGKDGDVARQGLVSEVVSGVHSGIVADMLKKNQFMKAKAYFDTNRDEMTSKDAERLQGAVADGSDRAWSLNKADEIIAKSKDEEDAIGKLQSVNADKRKGVTEAVRSYYSLQRQAHEERQKDTFENMSKSIQAGTSLIDMKTQPEWFFINDTQRKSLQATVKMKSEGVEANGDLFYGLKEQAIKDRNAFSKRNLGELRGMMTDSELNGLIDLQTGLKQGDAKQLVNLDKFKTQSMVASDVLYQLGYNPDAKPDERHGKQVMAFKRLLNEQVDLFKNENQGKSPTAEEIQKLAAGLAVKNITVSDTRGSFMDSIIPAGAFGDSKAALFELGESDIATAGFKDIPESDKRAIGRLLISRGLPTTEVNMVSYYNNKIRRNQVAK